MGVSRVTGVPNLTGDWSNACAKALDEPDRHFERLFELAERDQWTVAGLSWSEVDLSVFPLALRQTAADLMAQLQYGELTAMHCAAKLIDALPTRAARLAGASQVNDEARHVRFFANLQSRLGCEGRVRPAVLDLMASVQDAPTPQEMMLVI